VGSVYTITGYVKSGTSGNESGYFEIYAPYAAGDLIDRVSFTTSSSWTRYSFVWTATRVDIALLCVKYSSTAGTMLFDSLTMFEIETGHIVFDMGSALATDTFAIANYSWTSAPGLLKLEFNPVDSWVSPAETEALTWVARPATNGNEACIAKKFTSHTYRYLRLVWGYQPAEVVTDTDVGRVYSGTAFEPTINYLIDWSEDIIDPSLTSLTVGGQAHTDEIEMYRVVEVAMSPVTQAQWELVQKMIRSVGVRKDLFVAFDYDNEPNEMTIYGRFSALPGMTRKYPSFDMDLEFTESR